MKQAGLGLLVVAVLACGACNRAGQHEASYAAAPAQDAIKREQAASEQEEQTALFCAEGSRALASISRTAATVRSVFSRSSGLNRTTVRR